jgi:hypothetical protein
MGTNLTLGAAVVAAGAEDAAGLLGVAAGLLTVATGALADGVAAPAADDVLALQADSASPTPRPSAEMPAILVIRAKFSELIVSLILPLDQT